MWAQSHHAAEDMLRQGGWADPQWPAVGAAGQSDTPYTPPPVAAYIRQKQEEHTYRTEVTPGWLLILPNACGFLLKSG